MGEVLVTKLFLVASVVHCVLFTPLVRTSDVKHSRYFYIGTRIFAPPSNKLNKMIFFLWLRTQGAVSCTSACCARRRPSAKEAQSAACAGLHRETKVQKRSDRPQRTLTDRPPPPLLLCTPTNRERRPVITVLPLTLRRSIYMFWMFTNMTLFVYTLINI